MNEFRSKNTKFLQILSKKYKFLTISTNYSTILIKIQINLQILSKKIQIILQLFYNFNKNTN